MVIPLSFIVCLREHIRISAAFAFEILSGGAEACRSTPRGSARRRTSPTASGAKIAVLLFIPTLIPSDWTQDVPKRYGDRHPGMTHSRIHPAVDS